MSERWGVSPEKARRLTTAEAFKELEIKCLRRNFVKAANKNDLLGHAIKNVPGRGHLAQPSLPSAAPEPAGSDARGPTGLGLSQLRPHHPAARQARGLTKLGLQ